MLHGCGKIKISMIHRHMKIFQKYTICADTQIRYVFDIICRIGKSIPIFKTLISLDIGISFKTNYARFI